MHEEAKQVTTGYASIFLQISRWMAAVGAIMFGVMMMITVIDVGGRYIFTKPLNGAAEIIGVMLVIGGTWGIGYCQIEKMHIRINLLVEKFSPLVQKLLWILTYLVSGAVGVLAAWQAFSRTGEFLTSTLGTRSDVLGIPFAPFMLAMGIGFGWAGVIFIMDLVKTVIGVFKK